LDFIPIVGNAKALVEAAIGRDPITGRKLESWERGASAAAILGGPLVKGVKHGAKLGAKAISGATSGSKAKNKTVNLAKSPTPTNPPKQQAPSLAKKEASATTATPAKANQNAKGTDDVGKGARGADESDDILVDSYKNFRNNKEIPGQAHHLNQDAAFRDYIPRNDGLSVKLEGNIFKDIGSPHYNAHESLENFWDVYRKKGDLSGLKPTLTDYNNALRDSLINAGLSKAQANKAVSEAIKQQLNAGLLADDFVPRIPGKINLPKPKP
ncbi:MAG: pre-toxin TG domain-containing protein, partial [Priestia megaterium]